MKKSKIIVTTLILSTAMSITSLAGQWRQDAKGYWYENGDGSYPTNQWQKIDGKYYYFDLNGYMLHDTTTSDGYQVGSDGAWIVISEKEAIEKVRAYILKTRNGACCEIIEIDRIEGDNYIVHAYEYVDLNTEFEHTATWEWIQVNRYTGDMVDIIFDTAIE